MSEPERDDEAEAATLLSGASPLILAREYWATARAIGDPGSPNMIEAADQQRQHALMASTAALVSMAESLHELALAGRANRAPTRAGAKSLDTLAKEMTKIRQGRR